jgi:hypothetical protein
MVPQSAPRYLPDIFIVTSMSLHPHHALKLAAIMVEVVIEGADFRPLSPANYGTLCANGRSTIAFTPLNMAVFTPITMRTTARRAT